MEISVRPLRESDLPAADRILRLAFGTFLGLPDPLTMFGDKDYIRTRWRLDPTAALGAEADGQLVGSNFATHWGSVGFFGPLSVHPDFWDQGVAKQLLEPTLELFARWGVRHAGLYTFAQSPKHIGLYQRFGFWPRFLTAIMSRPVPPVGSLPPGSRYSEVPKNEQAGSLRACRQLTDALYQGLDLEREIRLVHAHGLGDTVLLWEPAGLAGLAICHCGPGSEAGSGACYIKFGAVRPGPTAGELFDRLLDACEALAAAQGMSCLVAGVNLGRHEAYRRMIARGFRTEQQGVVMQRPNEPGYHRPDIYAIDDWR
ncbi:MAG: GNAT family N-acetyltransferase [Candidatus Tectomicrobia bacterium]|uniref:GNAT family N-acetyltransferase n=1 Tax=Tectimicrobiota bacterium TaxID=2528274 RepID=A0A932FVU6_UNCTE|nr:GNAT family N-acetyltransferase [Candidatus Tectomicrobia bacterium]